MNNTENNQIEELDVEKYQEEFVSLINEFGFLAKHLDTRVQRLLKEELWTPRERNWELQLIAFASERLIVIYNKIKMIGPAPVVE